MHPCSLCRIQCADTDSICIFCRARDRFWRSLDLLPVRARGWGLQNLRIWTGIVEEELERLAEAEKQQAAAEGTAAPKSGSAVVSDPKPTEKVDKSWLKPKEERAPSPGTSRPGLVEIGGDEEEGKFSSGSKPEKEKERHRSSRRRSSRRSRSRRHSHRSRSRKDRKRKKATSSEGRRKSPRKEPEGERERKVKPSVRPPRTPSRPPPRRSPPKPKPPKRLPVAKAKQRPTGRDWQGPATGWKLDPSYYGVNKGVKKRERHYQGDQGGR